MVCYLGRFLNLTERPSFLFLSPSFLLSHSFTSFLPFFIPSLPSSPLFLQIEFPEREETKFSSFAGGAHATGRATATLRLCEGV